MESAENNVVVDDQKFCVIEASVTTGFEECARGEAKEKFGVKDVKAARGKITWTLPIDDNLKNVTKLGSIDNARVVLISESVNFSDQYSSLVSLQQLVPSMNWEQGLQVWQTFMPFPHTVTPRPSPEPSPEDLIDVVVFPPEKLKKKQNKEGKKKRGGGKDKKDNKKVEAEANKPEDSKKPITILKREGDQNNSKDTESDKTNSECPGPRTVIIKKADRSEKEPDIEIKVLDHGNEDRNVFPTDGADATDRSVEPMEVDMSLLNQSALSSKGESPPKDTTDSSSTQQTFVSDIINRLSAPATEDSGPTPSCTPPSTPVATGALSPFPSTPSSAQKVYGESSVDPPTPVKLATIPDSTKTSDTPLPADKSSSADPPQVDTEPETTKAPPSPAKPITSPKKERDPTKPTFRLPTFRVTCNRVGEDHTFDSNSAAASLGSAIMNYHGWQVDLHKFDIEIFLNILNNDVTVSAALTKTSLHNRNMVAFGATTLRSTICYNMLRLCRIKNGDFICDPMCGTSAIPVESALNWPHCYTFGGDMHEKAIEKSVANIDHLQKRQKEEGKGSLKMDAVQWDITHFPLRDGTVDVFVCDLPFGKRMGSRHGNKTLYPALLEEMARCARVGARACLLSEDRNNLVKAITGVMAYWQRRLILCVNIGGLNGFVFLLTRTDKPFIVKVKTDKVDRDSFDRESVKLMKQEISDSKKTHLKQSVNGVAEDTTDTPQTEGEAATTQPVKVETEMTPSDVKVDGVVEDMKDVSITDAQVEDSQSTHNGSGEQDCSAVVPEDNKDIVPTSSS